MGRNPLDPQDCLRSTHFLDTEHPAIQAKVSELKLGLLSERERAVRLFQYVRDEILYEFMPKGRADQYVASWILTQGQGFCVQKAVLLATLGRAAGIPTALAFADFRDQTLPKRAIEMLGGDTLRWHGVAAFYLGGDWRRADATFSPELVARKGYFPVEFDGSGDALQPPLTLDGRPHASYPRWYGLYEDLPWTLMQEEFEVYAEQFSGFARTSSVA